MSDASLFDMQAFDTPSEVGTSNPATTALTTHSLYRKYRPTTFADDDLVGQEHVVHTLRNALALNRISHAYLFCGPRGTGKTTTARLLAKAVNCLDADPHNRPCNTCDACVAINSNATTDVIEIDAASNRGIDDIRDLRERVKYAPTQLKTKFYIIDEAHQITGAAANAFLKTLEEPPSHTKFVLATTDPEELLQTIVSRCQRFDFRRINSEAMLTRLRNVADQESIEVEDEALAVIGRQATGSLRDALGMLDQVAVYRESADESQGPVTADTVRNVLGVSRNERVETLTRALAERDPAAGLREVSAAVEAGDDIRQLGRQLIAYVRLLLLQKAGGTVDADGTAVELASRFSLDELAGLIRQMSDIDFRAKRSAFPQLPLEIAIVEGTQRGQSLADPAPSQRPQVAVQPATSRREQAPEEEGPPDYDSIEAPDFVPQDRSAVIPSADRGSRPSLRDRVRGTTSPPSGVSSRDFTGETSAPVPATPEPGPKRSPEPEPSTRRNSSNPGELSLESIVELWSKIRADVKAVNRRIEALLQQVDPASVEGSQIVLVSPYEFHRNRVNTDEVRQVVESVISRLVNTQVQVTCVTRDEAQRQSGGTSVPASPNAKSDGTVSANPEARSIRETVDPGAPVEAPTGTSVDDVIAVNGVTRQSEKDDAARITAAKNIFDAEEIVD